MTELTHDNVQQAAWAWLHAPFDRVAMCEIGLPHGEVARYVHGTYRADVLAIRLHDRRVWIVEAKASRQDFQRGLERMGDYQRWCDLFYVACPAGMIGASELPRGAGLLYVRANNGGKGCHARVQRRATLLGIAEAQRDALQQRMYAWLLAFYTKTVTEVRREWPDYSPGASTTPNFAPRRQRPRTEV